MNLFVILLSLEMLFVNLFTSYTCSKKKFSPAFTWGFLSIFTVALFVLVTPFAILRPETNIGSGLLVLVGFLYLIPLYLLFDQSPKKTALIMFSSWIYTMLVSSLSFRIGRAFPTETPALLPFIVQTIVYILTLHFFLKFVQNKFAKIVQMMEKSLINRTLVISSLWFSLIFMINYTSVMGHNLLLELSILVLLGCTALLTYLLFYSLVSLNQRANTLKLQTKRDQLTKLRNRACLYDDMDELIESEQPFYINFIDLDNFKWVNDTYGHIVGDSYLRQVVREIQEKISPDDHIYRLAGDEFVIISKGKDINEFSDSLKAINFIETLSNVPYQGLSLGVSAYPVDAVQISDLLHLADEKMYQAKKIKHHIEYSF